MTEKDFIKICSDYEGVIEENEDTITFKDTHEIHSYYQDGKLNRKKKVLCVFTFNKITGSLNREEKTYEIKGGFGFPYATDKQLIYELEFYEFKKKTLVKTLVYEQLKLF